MVIVLVEVDVVADVLDEVEVVLVVDVLVEVAAV